MELKYKKKRIFHSPLCRMRCPGTFSTVNLTVPWGAVMCFLGREMVGKQISCKKLELLKCIQDKLSLPQPSATCILNIALPNGDGCHKF